MDYKLQNYFPSLLLHLNENSFQVIFLNENYEKRKFILLSLLPGKNNSHYNRTFIN